MHPSAYDILGVVFGTLSVLGIFRYLHRWLESRQPPSRLRELNAALTEVQSVLTQLERAHYPNPSSNPSALSQCRHELHLIHQRSLSLLYAVDRWSGQGSFAARWRDAIHSPLVEDILSLRQHVLQMKGRLLLLHMEALAENNVRNNVWGTPARAGNSSPEPWLATAPNPAQSLAPPYSRPSSPLSSSPRPKTSLPPSPFESLSSSSSPSLRTPPPPQPALPKVLPKVPAGPDTPASWDLHAHPQGNPQHETGGITTLTGVQSHVQESTITQRRPGPLPQSANIGWD
ncbi:hypothetical protein BV20DRAFT_122153 [Pilatotrama ljubarskyi]|nr:hypothetical protein BV20DRAFT_122153 [Pilatotrama ljubarskyi]